MEIYLDNAATSHPKPPEVISAVREALTDLNGNPGRSGHKRALAGARRMNECRETLAGFIGCGQVSRLSFCFNCTDALNLAIKGVLRRGDHVVSTLLEHNSVLRVLEELRRAGQIEVTLLEPRGHFVEPEQFEEALKKNTRLAVVTQASNVTGALQPAAAICQAMKRRGVLSLVDGAQAIGHLPVDVRDMGCDLYAFPGHKGLLGPQGTGGLYAACALRPLREGGTGSTSDQMTQPRDLPDRYESGTMNLPGLSGLWAGVRLVQAHQAAYLHNERERTAELLEGLRGLPGATVYGPQSEADRVGVVSFNLGAYESSFVADYLDRQGIAVRGGLHCAPGAHRLLGTLSRGAVRASVGRLTASEDIQALLRALRTLS